MISSGYAPSGGRTLPYSLKREGEVEGVSEGFFVVVVYGAGEGVAAFVFVF